VNTSDQTISAYTVDPSTGTLTQIGSPIPEGQVGPVAVTVEPSGRFLYVVNTNVTGMQGSVSAYQIDSTSGALTPITGSPFAAGTNPVSITIDLEGEFMFVPNSGSNNVSLYQISPLQQSPQTPAGALISSAGTLNAGTNPSSVALHPLGGFLYIANSGSGDIWMYCPNAAYDSFKLSNCPTGFQSVITTVGPNLQSVVIDTSGKYLYVAGGTSGSGSLWAYSINQTTGALTAVTGSPFVVGVNPTSITIDNSGQFVYVTNSGSNSISVFKIDPNTGALTAVAGSPFPAGTTPKFITTIGTVQ